MLLAYNVYQFKYSQLVMIVKFMARVVAGGMVDTFPPPPSVRSSHHQGRGQVSDGPHCNGHGHHQD